MQVSARGGKVAQVVHAGAACSRSNISATVPQRGTLAGRGQNTLIHSAVTKRYPPKSSLFPKKSTGAYGP